jgi:hypothetical protein
MTATIGTDFVVWLGLLGFYAVIVATVYIAQWWQGRSRRRSR